MRLWLRQPCFQSLVGPSSQSSPVPFVEVFRRLRIYKIRKPVHALLYVIPAAILARHQLGVRLGISSAIVDVAEIEPSYFTMSARSRSG